MSNDEDDVQYTHWEGLGGGAGAILSNGAFQMHTFGIMISFDYDTPGFVPDDYLNSITADSTTEVAELCAAGLWRRAESGDGYDVLDDETIEQFRSIRRRLADDS